MNSYSYITLIPLLPLAVFVVLGLFGRKSLSRYAGWIGTVVMTAVLLLSLRAAVDYFSMYASHFPRVVLLKYTWLSFSPGLSIDMGIMLEPVALMMLIIVSFVSLMVHVFSMGYMKGEKRFATYYAFLSLFTFSMLGLVLASNLFQVYMFWELVGVSSFLLIGYYFEKPSAVAAAKKAFIVTRFADLGFLAGILVLSFYGGSLDIQTLIDRLSNPQSAEFINIAGAGWLGVSALSWGLSLIFIGGAGKSAMFPLHIWLPDAMEGPTPVSALIHAATMVVAGVYLVARMFPVFSIDVPVMDLITYVGAFSALFAAIIACTQTDIKRVLAYSTMSQIGYMMFALGISAYSGEHALGYAGSLFHLFTHAFFKSLLFLCAGAVIHFVHSNEMKDMGGLRRYMPITHLCFLVGCLAISGIPPFAGFFSKEEILSAAYHSNKIIYITALFTAVLTSFYMFRLYFSVFWNKPTTLHNTPGEGTLSMKIPMVVLAVCSVAGGLVPLPFFTAPDGEAMPMHTNLLFSIAPVALAVVAIAVAAMLYKKESERPSSLVTAFGPLYRLAQKKFYIDEVYLFITKKIIFPLIGQPIAWIDRNVVDGMVNVSGEFTVLFASLIKRFQSGKVQQYALYFFGGIAMLALLFIYVWK